MIISYKPAGYTSVAPYLIVAGATETIEFLKRAFGALELRLFRSDTGQVLHAEVRIDDTVVMLADSAVDWPPAQAHVHISVKDVDATYRLALEAGAESIQSPIQNGDEDKRGAIKDKGGTTWWISTKVE